jgi:hypothetical protein
MPLTVAGRRLGDVRTGEIGWLRRSSEPLVGNVGVAAALPITTFPACLLVTRTVARKRPAGRTEVRVGPVSFGGSAHELADLPSTGSRDIGAGLAKSL